MSNSFGGQRFRHLVADDRSIYGVLPTGELMWFPAQWDDPAKAPRASAGRQIGIGWNDVDHMITGGDGIIYTVSSAGEVRWLKDERRDGSNGPGGNSGWNANSGSIIATGWQNYARVVDGGGGVIYAVDAFGHLLFYQDFLRDGTSTPQGHGWLGTSGQQIGIGWTDNRWVLSGGGGVLYVIDNAGNLRWYRDDLQNGTNSIGGLHGWAANGGAVIGTGWQWNIHAFSAAPGEIIVVQTYCAQGGMLRKYIDRNRNGTPNWQVVADAGTQFSLDDRFSAGWQIAPLEGYAWPLSVDPGESVRFHVSARMRFGCASGVVRLTGPAAQGTDVPNAAQQIDWLVFAAEFQPGGSYDSDCGWPAAFTLTAPSGDAALPPGFYAGRVSSPIGPSCDMPFVIRRGVTDGSVALIVNVNCWNAYNAWGGASNYTTDFGTDISLTFKRPAPHLLTSSQDSVNGDGKLRSEIWLLDWLQRFYAVTLLTDIDLHNGAPLSHYKAVVVGSHPEYWTPRMLESLRAYLDGGGSLLNLGANAAYRPTDLTSGPGSTDADLMTTVSLNFAQAGQDFPDYEGKPLFGAWPGNPFSFNDASGRQLGYDIVPGAPFVPAEIQAAITVGTDGLNPSIVDGSDARHWGALGCEFDSWAGQPIPGDCSVIAKNATNPAYILTYRTQASGFVLGVGSIAFVGAMVGDSVLQQIVLAALADAHCR